VIRDLCLPDSVPRDFDVTLRAMAHTGYRVLACGVRPLQDTTREGCVSLDRCVSVGRSHRRRAREF
jgi:hypothetical protein